MSAAGAVNKLAFNSIPAGAGRRAALPASSGARWRFVMLAPKRARSCSSSAGASLARASSGEKFALPPPPAGGAYGERGGSGERRCRSSKAASTLSSARSRVE